MFLFHKPIIVLDKDKNYFDQDVHFFEAIRLTLVKKNRQNGERRKRTIIYWKLSSCN